MKFTSAILSLGFALSAVATPTVEARGPSIVERDLATITGVLSMVDQKTTALDTSIKGYNGGSVTSLQAASDSLVDTINSGTTTVRGSGNLQPNDAIALIQPVQALTNDVKTAINDLIAKKSAFVGACQGGKVLSDLNQQKTAATALSNAIVSKVPQSLQSTAQQLAAGIANNLQRGIDAFQGTDNSDCSSSSSAGSSTATASSSSSASASSSSAGSSSSSAASSSSSAAASSSSEAVTTPAVTGASSTAAVSTPAVETSAAPSTLPSVSPNAASLKSVSAPAGIVAAIAAILAF